MGLGNILFGRSKLKAPNQDALFALTTACVIFLYLSYVMPTAVGIFALGKTWTHFGPFRLPTAVFRVLGVISVIGVLALVWIYYAALIVFVGALFTAVVDERRSTGERTRSAAKAT